MRSNKMWLEYSGLRYEYIDEGAFGAIFKNDTKNTIIKLFHAMTERCYAELIFKAEVDAYLILSTSHMSDFAPSFFGAVDQQILVQDLPLNHQGFHADLGYETEFLSGKFVKAGVGSRFNNLASIRNELRQIGISHTSDISVLETDGAITKIIDFATSEIEIWHTDHF